jgi:hypothetical protein
MRELLFGGILYLTGVAIILVIKPRLLFKDNGDWKEFGIGRNPATHTWMPFGLFCIFWALISYSMIYVLLKYISPNGSRLGTEISNILPTIGSNDSPASSPKPSKSRGLRRSIRASPVGFGNMGQGYYVLNENAMARNGIPHYRYVGPQAPVMTGGGGMYY